MKTKDRARFHETKFKSEIKQKTQQFLLNSAQDAKRKLNENRQEINRLAKEQKDLKAKCVAIWDILRNYK